MPLAEKILKQEREDACAKSRKSLQPRRRLNRRTRRSGLEWRHVRRRV